MWQKALTWHGECDIIWNSMGSFGLTASGQTTRGVCRKGMNGKGSVLDMTRREERELVFSLLFEREFQPQREVAEMFDAEMEARDVTPTDYLRDTFFGVCEKQTEIDALITENANGWRADRLTRTARSVLRLALYEMLFGGLPASIAINEAIELDKKFDDEKTYGFINGVLNGVEKKRSENG